MFVKVSFKIMKKYFNLVALVLFLHLTKGLFRRFFYILHNNLNMVHGLTHSLYRTHGTIKKDAITSANSTQVTVNTISNLDMPAIYKNCLY